jgi:hypothetical protein
MVFDVRFKWGTPVSTNCVVRNHKEGAWDSRQEERSAPCFPFQREKEFQIIIMVDRDCFKVINVNQFLAMPMSSCIRDSHTGIYIPCTLHVFNFDSISKLKGTINTQTLPHMYDAVVVIFVVDLILDKHKALLSELL